MKTYLANKIKNESSGRINNNNDNMRDKERERERERVPGVHKSNLMAGQNFCLYLLTRSKGVFINATSKINKIWGCAGLIKSFYIRPAGHMLCMPGLN